MIYPAINEVHRKELLRFLLLKTAAVRSGIKPGELLRIQHCYKSKNPEGFQFCLYKHDILSIMKLDFIELKVDHNSSLILFFHAGNMQKTLTNPAKLAVLADCGYNITGDYRCLLAKLQERFKQNPLPHEVGVFIGYPAKDVVGFINNLPRTPVHKGLWAVFGDAKESVHCMNTYRKAEQIAQHLLDMCDDLQTYFDLLNKYTSNREFAL